MSESLSGTISSVHRQARNHWLRRVARRSPAMFVTLLVVWTSALVWFGPRLVSVLDAANGPLSAFALLYFIVFIAVAWLYGMYNLSVVAFSIINRFLKTAPMEVGTDTTRVAVLYTTCNDFVEASALSCVNLDYANFNVYILDDSSDETFKRAIDQFAGRHDNVQVVRRRQRVGFKAGNLNHALKNVATEPLFVIADSDEVLPSNFLTRLVPRINGDPQCGFIQANHRCIARGTKLQRDLSAGIDVHWKWYQPLRNRFGFVMFLGHGALLRRHCWNEAGGFPEVVSEDLAYAIAIRERGFYGRFAEDVVCFEEFPDTVRAFRVRHVKWTRGTCEFLHHYGLDLLRSRRISWGEKLDILFPTANLPITLFFFMFMIVSAILLPLTIGEHSTLTLEVWNATAQIPVMIMPTEMNALYTWDFFTLTVLAMLSPVLCFVLEMWKTPVKLIKFLAHSTALYATLAALSTICIVGYAVTRQARFLVTGDKSDGQRKGSFWRDTHPDAAGVHRFEWLAAMIFAVGAIASFQIALFGLAVGYALVSAMNSRIWGETSLHALVWVPFTFIMTGMTMGGMSLLGVQPVFFGFGFHF